MPRLEGAAAVRRSISMVVVATVAVLSIAVPAAPAGVPRPGFVDELHAGGMGRPTALAFLPNGDTLVTAQTGELRRVTPAGGVTQIANFSAEICSASERGLLGVAVDPAFATGTRWIYLYRTFKKFGTCNTNTADAPRNRVSRYWLYDATGIDVASEQILIDGIPSPAGNHNGGDLEFGNDGMLYVSVGDGGCHVDGSGCGTSNLSAQQRNVLSGKILRVTKFGTIPADNPYRSAGTWRCSGPGIIPANQVCQEIWAFGLRNPFRLVDDPAHPATSLRIHDVGGTAWEEIDVGAAKRNFGWPIREGNCAANSTTNCGPPPAGMTNPIWAYSHAATGCRAITGGAWVPPGAWGSAWDGTYLYGDYICAKMFAFQPKPAGGVTFLTFASSLGPGGPVDMEFGPTTVPKPSLSYLTFANGGELRRIHLL